MKLGQFKSLVPELSFINYNYYYSGKIIILSKDPYYYVFKSTGVVNVKFILDYSPTLLFGFHVHDGTFSAGTDISLATNIYY